VTNTRISEFKGIEWTTAGHHNRILSVKYLEEEPNLIISGGWDSNVNIWDTRTHRTIGGFTGPKIAGDSIDYKNGVILTGSNSIRD